jgi:uncharacterized protein with FMN-binding domain
MNRALGAIVATVLGVVWLVTFKVTPLSVEAVASEPPRTAPPATPQPTSAATARPSAPPSGTPAASGTFTGATVSTIYGPVQVRVVVSGQKVIDVQPLQLPSDRARSVFISQYSAPILRTESIQAQSARIDIVTGATYTSIAYGRSLDSALKQAHL